MRPRRFASRHAYTLAELMIVIAIVGILTAVTLPRYGKIRDQGQMASATTRFTRAVMAARQSAIQRGKPAYFKTNNSSIWVTLDTTGNNTDSVVVTPRISLTDAYGVEVTTPTGLVSIAYDPRGVSTQASKQVFYFKHTGSGRQDSLCVSRLGNTIRERCP
jgi:prepilin-type N-terminal cleavage/methylation domain-containing protein